MATPALLEFDLLLAPIPGEEPAGVGVPLPTREKLDAARKTIDPNDFDPNDPTRPEEFKLADWPAIVEYTQTLLVESSKDLMIVARLTEGATRLFGFAGLRDSLILFRRLLDECWDRIRPTIEEPDDIEARAAALTWLDDPTRGARFPLTVRSTPLLQTPKGPISWMDWDLIRSGRGTYTAEELDQAVGMISREMCVTAVEDLEEVIGELQALQQVLVARMGDVSPGLVQIRQAVFDCRTLAHQFLDRKGPASEEASAHENERAEATGGDGERVAASRSMTSRADVYRRLAEAADILARLEPHSPVPYLIRRAVALGDLPFPDLIKALILDSSVLHDLARNLGIQELSE